jgi:hypothetical protein
MTKKHIINFARIISMVSILLLAGHFSCAAQGMDETTYKLYIYGRLPIAVIGALAVGVGINRLIRRMFRKKPKKVKGTQDFEYHPTKYNPWAKPVAFLCSCVVVFITYVLLLIILNKFFFDLYKFLFTQP